MSFVPEKRSLRLPRLVVAAMAAIAAALPLSLGLLGSSPAAAQTRRPLQDLEMREVEFLRADGRVETGPNVLLEALRSQLLRPDWDARLTADSGLPEAYAAWLTRDVAWIISDGERARFVTLGSNQERDRFIEQFWQRRNPGVDPRANQFKEEHYRRAAYGDRRFSDERPGRQTDRGRLYIQLGPPDEIESHPAQRKEMWLYRHVSGSAHALVVTFRTPASQ